MQQSIFTYLTVSIPFGQVIRPGIQLRQKRVSGANHKQSNEVIEIWAWEVSKSLGMESNGINRFANCQRMEVAIALWLKSCESTSGFVKIIF